MVLYSGYWCDWSITSRCYWSLAFGPGGVRHDPQRFMGKTVTVPHFNRDTVEFASRKRNESNPGIITLLPFPKNRERFRECSRSHSGLRCLLLASQDNFKKFIAIRRRSCDLADFERRLIFLLLIRFYVLFGLYVCIYLMLKEICSSYLDLLN